MSTCNMDTHKILSQGWRAPGADVISIRDGVRRVEDKRRDSK